MPKLSIIVPVYNVERYLDECISSVVEQTFSEFELLLVDDGSMDSSGRKCDEWAQRDKRITVFHKENGGLMSAWKYGVLKARGEYIGFVDSDDWIDKDMYQRLMGVAESQQVDMVCAALVFEEPNGEKCLEKIKLRSGRFGREDIEREVYPVYLASKQFRTRGLSPNRVTKIYKRSVLLEVLEDCDETVSIGEDLLTTFAFMQKAQSIYLIDDFNPYHYRLNNTSMTRKFDKEKYEKVTMLKAALLKVNSKYGNYDFEKQIHTDYIDLFLRLAEKEILATGKYKQLKNSLKKTYYGEAVQSSLAMCEKDMLNKKDRMYLLLLKWRMYGVLVLIRKGKTMLS